MSLKSHWFQNGQPSKFKERKKKSVEVRKSPKIGHSFVLPTLTAGHFGISGSSETLCTSFKRSHRCVLAATKLKGVTPLYLIG